MGGGGEGGEGHVAAALRNTLARTGLA